MLAAQLELTAPADLSADEAAAVAALEETTRQFLVAEGLPDAAWPPLLSKISPTDPAVADDLLSAVRRNAPAGVYALGPLTVAVTSAAGDASTVLIDLCTDYTERVGYDASGAVIAELNTVVRSRFRMDRAAEGFVVAQFVEPEEQDCA